MQHLDISVIEDPNNKVAPGLADNIAMLQQIEADDKEFNNTNMDAKKLLLRPDRSRVTFEQQK